MDRLIRIAGILALVFCLIHWHNAVNSVLTQIDVSVIQGMMNLPAA
ncbi:MAG: hypothetical protein ACQR33_05555 [Candidatus Saccharibacteria bacterium]